MGVKPNTVQTQRMSKLWDEKDDAALEVLLKRKVKELQIAIRESTTPFEKTKLKAQREHYKSMLHKVKIGAYNGDIIFHELRAQAALAQEQSLSNGLHSGFAGGKNYTSTYNNMDFDYEAAFRKKRYYGFALPFFLLILTLLLTFVFVAGILTPTIIPQELNDTIQNYTTLNLDSLIVYRLGAYDGGTFDIGLSADDNGYWWWPSGNYGENTVKLGEPWTDSNGVTHDADNEVVYLYADLGCTEIYIDAADIIKAWFRTKMLEKVRLDFIEDLSVFQGESYYYDIFLSGSKSNALVIKTNENGGLDVGVIFNHIGVYGIIINIIILFILLVIMIIQNIIRLFSYTSRKCHITTLLFFIFSLITAVLPAFATSEGTDVITSLQNYFMLFTDQESFLASDTTTVGVSLLLLLPVVISLIMLILPKLFKNRFKAIPSRIPKGNKKAKGIH